MNSGDIQTKLNKYKLKVKLWEKEFKEKNNRIPSKHDIKEAGREIKDAYKMYYKITTSLLSNTLTDALEDDDDDGSPVREAFRETSFSSASKTDPQDSSNSDINISSTSRDLPTQETLVSGDNVKVWGNHLCKKAKVSKTQPVGKSKITLASKLGSSMNFSKRNPRKSFSRINSTSSDKGESSRSITSPTGIPDFETLLSQRSTQIPEIVAPESDNKSLTMEKNFDTGWIERCGGETGEDTREIDPSQFTSKLNLDSSERLTFGLSMGNIPKPAMESSSTVTRVSKEADSDGSVVEDSEDEAVIFSQQSVRHVLKKRKVFSSIHNRQARENERIKAEQEEAKKKLEQQARSVQESQKIPKKSSCRKTRGKNDVNYREDYSDEDSIENDALVPPKTRGRTQQKLKKQKKDELPPEASTNDQYLPPLDTDFTKKIPRVGEKFLSESEKLFSSYIRQTLPEDSLTKEPKKSSRKAQAKEKLQQKVSSGKANENFVKINMKKKVFVRGKKTLNFSKYKKTLWRRKKAAALLDDKGCDGGEFKCFECGATGHFATKCPRKENFASAPVTEEADHEDSVEESGLQTLEEAADCAKMTEVNPKESTNYLEASEMEAVAKELEKSFSEDTQEAVYSLTTDGEIPETPPEVTEALHQFGHAAFRSGQERAIMRILCGLSTLVTLNTGSGKSLCYQLPALLYSRHGKGMTLVISPLVSLMEDQVSGIPSFLNARCLHTNQTPKMRQLVIQELKEGRVDLLMVSPEAVAYGDRKSEFGQILSSLPRIGFVCIDEAHCLSQWSHNFRPSYLMLCKILREKLKVSLILGLTATATNLTRDEIVCQIGVPDGTSGVISDIPLPNNLILTVSKDIKREDALITLLNTAPFAGNSVIIYCTRRDDCERVATAIRMAMGDVPTSSRKRKRTNWTAEVYHAGVVASRRRTIQNAFMSGELKIVVATIAFGMGINKPDIRAVIHFNMPKNFESYVQEIGRAGRDGAEARCHLFLDPKRRDKIELQRFIYANSLDRFTLRRLLQKIFVPCVCQKDGRRESCPGHEIAFSVEATVQALDIPEENISTLLCYLEQHVESIEMLSKAYVKCRVFSYGGAEQLKKVARSCPPLAMAISIGIKEGKFRPDDNSIEFSTVDVAAALGWDSGIVKYQLKNLEWTKINNSSRRTTISVQFDDIGFRIRAPGNFTDEQMDNILEMLINRVAQQENLEVYQLQSIFEGLTSVALPNVVSVLNQDCIESSEKLKTIIREYFERTQVGKIEVTEDPDDTTDEQLERDIRYMVANYPDTNFTGRSLARIFHGISSPNFPAIVWGRCKMWRAHNLTNIHRIIDLGNSIILKMRM